MYQCHDGRYWLLSFTVWEMIVWFLRAMLWLLLVEKSHLFKNPEKTWTEWLPSLEKLVVHHHPLEERLKDLICFLLIGYQLIIINTWLLYVPLFHLLKILVQESPPVARRVATVDRTPCSARGDSLLRVIFDLENLKKVRLPLSAILSDKVAVAYENDDYEVCHKIAHRCTIFLCHLDMEIGWLT